MALSLDEVRDEARAWRRYPAPADHSSGSWADVQDSLGQLDRRLTTLADVPAASESVKSCEERLRNICIMLRVRNKGREPGR